MKNASVVLFAELQLAADKPAENAAKDDDKHLEGTWKVASAESFGRPKTTKEIGLEQIVFNGSKLTGH